MRRFSTSFLPIVSLVACATAGTPTSQPTTMPASFGVLREVPISELRAGGWMLQWLHEMSAGLTGHVAASGYPFNKPQWNNPDPAHGEKDWSRYEQTAYWVDGALRCAVLSDDASLRQQAETVIQYVLDHPDADGYLGPTQFKKIRKDGDYHNFQWPQVVFFRALMAEYDATGNRAILDALTKHYLQGGADYTYAGRDVCNAEILYWLFGHTGDARLRDMADHMLAEFNKGHGSTNLPSLASDDMPRSHGVSFAEMGKLGAIAFLYNNNRELLDGSVNGFMKVARDHGLVDGQYSAQEGLNERGSLACHETCTIADYSWSLGYLLMATGDASDADKIEKAVYNAGFGSVLGDFKGLQYFSSPNQVLADRQSNHAPMLAGDTRMQYGPRHDVQCCSGNVHRIFPNLSARSWMTDAAGHLVATLYVPGTVTADGLSIVEETEYPFAETIAFTVHTTSPADKPISFRIPGWCTKASINVAGKPFAGELKAGTFVTVSRTWNDGDRVELTLPMTPRLTRWPEGGVAIEMGPLVFSLKIPEDAQPDPKSPELLTDANFPQMDIQPAGPWNDALDVDESTVATAVKITRHPLGPPPWDASIASPIELQVPARVVDGWSFWKPNEMVWTEHKNRKFTGPFVFTPPLPDPAELPKMLGDSQTITLVPYGFAKLRVTLFPSARPTYMQPLFDQFDGGSTIGWDASGATLNIKNSKGEFVAPSGNGSVKSGECLLDFSKPVGLWADREAVHGALIAEIVEPDGTVHTLPGDGPLYDLSKLDWHGPHRFRVVLKLAGAKPALATLRLVEVNYFADDESSPAQIPNGQ